MERYEAAHEALVSAPFRTWAKDGITYEITKIFKQNRGGSDLLSVDIRATKRKRVIYDDRNNFSNPPLQAIVNGETIDDASLALRLVLEDNIRIQTNGYKTKHVKRIGDSDTFSGDTLTAFAVDDAYVLSSNSSWATTQAGGGTLTATTANPNSVLCGRPSALYGITLSYLRFDTSSLGAGDTITAYAFSLYGTGTAEVNNLSSTIQARIHPGYGAGVPTTADWVNCATTWTSYTLFADFTLSGWVQTADTINTFTSQGAQSSINIDGNTDIVVGLSNNSGSAPAALQQSNFVFRSSAQSGTTSDPKLVITFTGAPQIVTPDPVRFTLTIPAPTVTGGVEVLLPDPVAFVLTIPEPQIVDLVRYEHIEQQSWSGDIYNRIQAGISPYTALDEVVVWTDPGPYILAPGESVSITATPQDLVGKFTGHTRSAQPLTSSTPVVESVATAAYASSTTYSVNMPATVAADDGLVLLLATASSTAAMAAPAGWVRKYSYFGTGAPGNFAFVRLADGTEDSTAVVFTNSNAAVAVSQLYRISNWAADTSDAGIVAGHGNGGTNTHPRSGTVSWSWGEIPTLVIAWYTTKTGNDTTTYPSGYTGSTYVESGSALNLASARKAVSVESSETPGLFTCTSSLWLGACLAINGPSLPQAVSSGSPSGSSGTFTISYVGSVGGTTQSHYNIQVTGIPVDQGDEKVVETNDITSQDISGVSTYRNPASLFRSTGDAREYADLVLSRYKDRHPVMTIGFTANKTSAYYDQVKTLRVGDRVTLVANSNTGLGISEDFWIESIHMRASQGKTLLEVEYELSPVDLS